MSSPDPNRLDSTALDRVLQRAAEMQASETDVGEGLTEREVLDLGKQVGIPQRYLQQAMLEERSRIELARPDTILDAWVGPREVMAQRVMLGTVESVERGLLDWMQKNELFTVQRQQPGRITWEKLSAMQAALRRGMSVLSAPTTRFMLSNAELVAATVAPLEDGYCHVTLTAELPKTRKGYLGGAAAMTSVGLAGTLILGALGALAVVVPIPLIGGAAFGWAIVRMYPPIAQRTQLGLERVLDHVERGTVKPAHQVAPRPQGLLGAIANEVRRVIAAPTEPTRTDRKDRP
jgi:hypothetical protein